jgi:hypothetical protein
VEELAISFQWKWWEGHRTREQVEEEWTRQHGHSGWRNLARYVLAGQHLKLWDATLEERAADLAVVARMQPYRREMLLVAEFVWSGLW